MNQKHHRVHCKMWEGMTSDDANDEFERLHVEQHGAEDEGPIRQVEVKDPYKRKREWKGVRSESGVVEQNTIGTEQAAVKRRRIMTKTAFDKLSEHLDSGELQGVELVDASLELDPPADVKPKTPASASSAAPSASASGGHATAPSTIRARSESALAVTSTSKEKDRRKGTSYGGGQKKRAMPAIEKVKEEGQPCFEGLVTEMDSSCFQEAKKRLLAHIGVLREVCCGEKGLKFKLDTASLRLEEKNADENDLDFSTQDLINQTEELDTKCGELADATKPCKKPDLADLLEKYDALKQQVLTLEGSVSSQVNGVNTKIGHISSAKTNSHNKVYWKGTKVQNQLMLGGYNKTAARMTANIFMALSDDDARSAHIVEKFAEGQLNPNAENFDIETATLFTLHADNIMSKFFKTLYDQKKLCGMKYEELRSCMVESPSW